MSRTGLVLEGGAMRGMFTAGVIDVLLENDVTFDGAIGVSAGAVFGCNIKSKQIGRAIRYNKRFCQDWHYGSLKSLILTGDLYDADFCYEQLPYELDPFDLKTYQANPMHFYITATDAKTGNPVYRDLKEGGGIDMEWFRASATMPIVSKPVKILGGAYLDGGISDSIPLTFMEKSGYDVNVVVLTQPEGYRKEPVKHEEALRAALFRYPAVAERLICRHALYNSELDHVFRERDAGKTWVIAPPEPLAIGSVTRDPNELERVYQIGRKTMQGQLEGMLEFLR
ncbi:MAG: patatin family protein [Lachnospiraceae bacterium]|jgi:predicted patatin/cPLA2 family phospholipase|nr:patatin family protein [Lachnospiraceae bacterium]